MKTFKLYDIIFDKKIIKRQVQYIPREDLFAFDTFFKNRIYKLRCLYYISSRSIRLMALLDLYEDLDSLNIDYGDNWFADRLRDISLMKYDKIKKVKLLQ